MLVGGSQIITGVEFNREAAVQDYHRQAPPSECKTSQLYGR